MADSQQSSHFSSHGQSGRWTRRGKGDQLAHSEASSDSGGDGGGPPDGLEVPRGRPVWISSQPDLERVLAEVRAEGLLAYDSEFIGELTYSPKLCLLQIASSRQIALVDPLAGLDLAPFWELVCDESVEKVVHAGQQDIEPAIRHLNRAAANVFDTQLAAGFAGLGYPVALWRLVDEVLGVRLGKGLTFTHWDRRPLSGSQMRYAADDVRYLRALRDKLLDRVRQLGHEAWLREECAAQCDPEDYRFDAAAQARRIRGASGLSPQGLAVLTELVTWRDVAARSHDLPPRTMLKDEVLLELSRTPVKSVERLSRVRGLPRPVEQAHGAEIVEATQRGLAAPGEKSAAAGQLELSPRERFAADSLWVAAQCLCVGPSVDPAVAMTRQEVGELYRHLRNGVDASPHRLMRGWRADAIGHPLMKLLKQKQWMKIVWEDGSMRASVEG